MANGNFVDDLYLENLEEEVLQLGNVVTYKWLVRTLKVSANLAKRLLFEFVEKQKAAGVQLNVTYLVAGEKAANGRNVPVHEIRVVPSSQLEAAKARFDTITSLHVYAVHKAEIKDLNVLYAADYSPTQDATMGIKNCSAIRCPHVALRPVNGSDIPNLTESSRIISRDEKKPERPKEQQPKSTSVASSCKKGAKNVKGRSQGTGLVGLFENMEKKKKDLKADEDVKVKAVKRETKVKDDEDLEDAARGRDCHIASSCKKSAKVKGRSQGTGLVGLFENMEKKKKDLKADEDVKVKAVKRETRVKEDDEDAARGRDCHIARSKDLTNVFDADSVKASEKPAQNQRKGKQKPVAEGRKGTREKRKAKAETTAKKRRRIIQMSDSSSEEEESDPENPIPTPYESPEEDVEEVAEIPERNPESSSRRSVHKRKLVQESVLDEEGYLVTQNNWKDCSGPEDSGDENEDPIPKAKAREEPKEMKKVTPKSKQVMLTSFFKKK